MMKIAGLKHSPIVLLEHVGRSSGNVYQTPIMASRHEDGFMFALTYGKGVDWYKNILASQEAKLTFGGKSYQLINPINVSPKTGQDAFKPPKSSILRSIGIQDFFFMKINSVISEN
jgi:deazaflavin-dependent oxidoreductase (nitroreductase family)